MPGYSIGPQARTVKFRGWRPGTVLATLRQIAPGQLSVLVCQLILQGRFTPPSVRTTKAVHEAYQRLLHWKENDISDGPFLEKNR